MRYGARDRRRPGAGVLLVHSLPKGFTIGTAYVTRAPAAKANENAGCGELAPQAFVRGGRYAAAVGAAAGAALMLVLAALLGVE